MAQNKYDDQEFFESYVQLPRQVIGLDGAPEWPTLRSMIPDLQGKKFLDLGCGFGWTSRWAREQGAEAVQGVDVSENMLTKARAFPNDPAIAYAHADLETFQIPSRTFDIVFSSLVFHYLENLPALIAQIYQGLTPAGTLVFSVEHPLWTAPLARKPKFTTGIEGRVIWPLDGYLDEGPRTKDWISEGIKKQHRTIATYFKILREAGFIVSTFEEWGPTLEQVAETPEWATDRIRPPFLLMKATKPEQA